jgi:MinD superfamily P-loop ATPase
MGEPGSFFVPEPREKNPERRPGGKKCFILKEIVVISGKGGTGKTTFATSLFASLPYSVLADCDVDAPDTHILLKPSETRREDFVGTRKARIDPRICRDAAGCMGARPCISACRFDAVVPVAGIGGPDVMEPQIRDSRCEGCGVCVHVCPAGAVRLEDTVVGSIAEGDTEWGPMVHAQLKPGEETSGKLVAEVRRRGRALAERRDSNYLIIDGSPGIGCPVISSLTGADLAVLVTEPSLAAWRDLERLIALLRQFRIPAVAVINKWDISPHLSERIAAFCEDSGMPVVMKLPFDPEMVQAVVRRQIPSTALPHFYQANGFENLLQQIR